jgi:phenylalanyl-tRNA synthetase alpha chain
MKDRLEELRREALAAAQDAACASTLQEVEVSFLGKKGRLTQILKGLGALSPEERPAAGQLANQVKNDITAAFAERAGALKLAAFEAELAPGSFDPTLPGPGPSPGGMHPVDLITRELEDLFLTMGFQVADGPEVELEANNFDRLNIQADHPAREAHDTIWVQRASQDSVGLCMRTHTSPVQIRTLQEMGAPLRVIAPGRVFRQESLDATHEHTFHQMEGLMVDKGISVPHLLHVMNTLIEGVFGKALDTRLRPGYFPFVEPGFELDARCSFCETGCKVCKGTRWIELIGCGMVHPKVLELSGVDPDVHSGFAFGLGLSRIAMLRYGIEDIRWMMGGSISFLSQFRK